MSNVQAFGAVGDGRTNNTAALKHAIEDGDGVLRFPPGVYRLESTIEVDLGKYGPIAFEGIAGPTRIDMIGKGPAIRIAGHHKGTADPASRTDKTRDEERFPVIRNLEFFSSTRTGDGIEFVGTMQPLVENVFIQNIKHGIALRGRNRSVLISNCQIYNNLGVGVLIEDANLHQINILGNHISYNRIGGIRIQRSEVRNLQITGNDIEYNNHRAHRSPPEPTAEIYVDTTAIGASVNEVTVCSNTIQATASPGGANIRIIEKRGEDRPPGLWTITGNVIGSQENNVHLTHCRGVTLTGNNIYSAEQANVLLEDCSQIILSGNQSRRHVESMACGYRLVNTTDSVIGNCVIEDESPEGQKSGRSLIELTSCERIQIQGCTISGGVPYGVDASDCRMLNISGCTIADNRKERKTLSQIRIAGKGSANLVTGNILGKSVEPAIAVSAEAGVTQNGNVVEAE
jgi:hypothetical protein